MASFQPKVVFPPFTPRRKPLSGRLLSGRLVASFLVLLMAGTALVPLAATPAAADGNSGQWSIAGAFLAGMNAKARGDMKVAAELLPLALAANPGDPGLIQATL